MALREEMLGRSIAPNEISIAKENFQKAINSMTSASQWDATKAAGSLAASEVASTIGMQVLLRMGVSAGILGAGAANSWWSFGGSLVLGVLVDMVWTWIDDPVGAAQCATIASRTAQPGLDKNERKESSDGNSIARGRCDRLLRRGKKLQHRQACRVARWLCRWSPPDEAPIGGGGGGFGRPAFF